MAVGAIQIRAGGERSPGGVAIGIEHVAAQTWRDAWAGWLCHVVPRNLRVEIKSQIERIAGHGRPEWLSTIEVVVRRLGFVLAVCVTLETHLVLVCGGGENAAAGANARGAALAPLDRRRNRSGGVRT